MSCTQEANILQHITLSLIIPITYFQIPYSYLPTEFVAYKILLILLFTMCYLFTCPGRVNELELQNL